MALEALGSRRLYERIYEVVLTIPRGKVATYGQIAEVVGRCTARMVGYAMAGVSCESGVPWHRVLNSRGSISVRADGERCPLQRAMLEAEGVRFDAQGRVDLRDVGWRGPGVLSRKTTEMP